MTNTSTDADRQARFAQRQAELGGLDDAALKATFWTLADELVAPIVELARTHTSPSIERSVLLRMGIDSLTTHAVVDHVGQAGLLGKGAGHVVLAVARRDGLDVRGAAAAIAADAGILAGLFDASASGPGVRP